MLRMQVASQTCLQSRLHAQHGAAQPTGQDPARGFPHPSSVLSVSSSSDPQRASERVVNSPLPSVFIRTTILQNRVFLTRFSCRHLHKLLCING